MTVGVRHPRTLALHRLRPAAHWLVRRIWDIHVHGADHVPATGPVIVAANHIGVIDGPLLAICSPRPVHALTKAEMFEGRAAWFFRGSGQIPLDRFNADPLAVRTSLAVLEAGGCVGIFPEGTRGSGELAVFKRGAAYLALVSGAPVVPLTFLGTREPGAGSGSLPPRRGRIDLAFGTPFQVPAAPWPRTREQVGRTTALLREHMVGQLDDALARTGRELPGPLPSGDRPDGDDPRV